jgi:hypothetical protein
MRYSTMINGYTSLNLTKLDVLDGFKEIKVATGYKIDGKEIEGFPGEFGIPRPSRWFIPSWSDALTRIPLRFILVADLDLLAKVEVEYATFPGWQSDISECTTFESLPENCQKYVSGSRSNGSGLDRRGTRRSSVSRLDSVCRSRGLGNLRLEAENFGERQGKISVYPIEGVYSDIRPSWFFYISRLGWPRCIYRSNWMSSRSRLCVLFATN